MTWGSLGTRVLTHPHVCIRPPGKGTQTSAVAPPVVQRRERQRRRRHTVEAVEDEAVNGRSKQWWKMMENRKDRIESCRLRIHWVYTKKCFKMQLRYLLHRTNSQWSKVGDDAGPDVIVGAEIDSKPLGCHHCVRQINGRKPGFLKDRPRATQMNWLLSFLEGS